MRGEGGEGGGTVQKGQGREEPGASKGRESEKVDWKEKESEGVGRREPSSIPLTAAAIQTQEERFCSPRGRRKSQELFFFLKRHFYRLKRSRRSSGEDREYQESEDGFRLR